MANGYPAVNVTVRVLERKIPDLRALTRYGRSVDNGVQSAARNVADLTGLCPQSYLVLGGYWQGAQVTREVLARLDAGERKRVATVVLFGDPYFDPREKGVTYFPGGARERRGFLLVLPRARAIPIGPVYATKVFSWCHPSDIICEGPFRSHRGQHGNYDADVGSAVAEISAALGRIGVRAAALYRHTVIGACSVCALAEWSGPGSASYERVGAADEGEQVNVLCQTVGEPVRGAGRSSAIWDELANGAFLPDYYVDTRGIGVPTRPIPVCHGLGVSSP